MLLSCVMIGHSAQSQSLRPISRTLTKALTDIDAVVDQAEKAAQQISPGEVKLTERRRTFLDESRHGLVNSVVLVRKQTLGLRNRPTLGNLFVLESVLGNYERQLEGMVSQLNNIELTLIQNGDPTGKVELWRENLEKAANALGGARLSFSGEALDLLDHADKALTRGEKIR